MKLALYDTYDFADEIKQDFREIKEEQITTITASSKEQPKLLATLIMVS